MIRFALRRQQHPEGRKSFDAFYDQPSRSGKPRTGAASAQSRPKVAESAAGNRRRIELLNIPESGKIGAVTRNPRTHDGNGKMATHHDDELAAFEVPTSYKVTVTDTVSREVIKTFGFESGVCRGRTPLETAWALAKVFVPGGSTIHVKLG
jgi:hypothetical protein